MSRCEAGARGRLFLTRVKDAMHRRCHRRNGPASSSLSFVRLAAHAQLSIKLSVNLHRRRRAAVAVRNLSEAIQNSVTARDDPMPAGTASGRGQASASLAVRCEIEREGVPASQVPTRVTANRSSEIVAHNEAVPVGSRRPAGFVSSASSKSKRTERPSLSRPSASRSMKWNPGAWTCNA